LGGPLEVMNTLWSAATCRRFGLRRLDAAFFEKRWSRQRKR
jgi:hypothetical protein